MNIALITEGGTDQIVLKPILETIFQENEVFFNAIQPTVDFTDRQTNFGGWQLVLKTLEKLEVCDLLQSNDLVVIQIDTDVSYLHGFDVPHAAPGKKVDPVDLCLRTIDKLRSLIPTFEAQGCEHRFAYAIGVHSIECWLLGLVDQRHGVNVIGGCFDKLNKALVRQKRKPISSASKNKGASQQAYRLLANKFSKPKTSEEQSCLNAGFLAFLSQLEAFRKKNE